MIKDISSTQNRTYKFIKSLKTKKARQKSKMYTVEGIKSVQDAMKAKDDISYIVVSDTFNLDFDFDVIYRIPNTLFEPLCDTETPQGILAVINMEDRSDLPKECDIMLYLDHVADPGNLGTIIRICDAVDCPLMMSCECADIYNPKTVRASMGSFFNTKITENVSYDRLQKMQKDGYKLISGALNDDTRDYREDIYQKKTIIIVGNEANGVSKELLSISDASVKIPIFGNAESLNVAIASALLLYKAKEMI